MSVKIEFENILNHKKRTSNLNEELTHTFKNLGNLINNVDGKYSDMNEEVDRLRGIMDQYLLDNGETLQQFMNELVTNFEELDRS